MNVLIFGGTGYIGRNLIKELLSFQYDICVVTRNRGKTKGIPVPSVKILEWDNIAPLPAEELKKIDVVVNLAGESIGGRRWTGAVKQEILDSRLRTTRAIVSAIQAQTLEPQLLVNASAVGYYGPRQDEELTEADAPGDDFLARVCLAWEKEAYRAQSDTTRVVTARLGVALGYEGALNRMLTPYRFFAGGYLGSGKQWLSWVHIQDLTGMLRWLIEHPEIKGPVNLTAPEPAQMRTVAQEIGLALNRPAWLPVPEFMLKIVLGQMSESILHGQRAVPKKLLDTGFKFIYPTIRLALQSLIKNCDQQ
ncbi:MAG: Epimerase family protein [Pelotomaculum sp. PtaB.Bin104]|nr:MAG: Epimerase family protein [Pelotomaculum sp. PtaB.Bin104]